MRWIAWLGAFVACLVVDVARGQELAASVDRGTIFAGETVRLTLEFRGDATGLSPDFSPLRSGFLLGDTTTSSQFNFVDGRRDVRTQWSIELEPRREGEILIPALRVGSSASQPLTVTVLPRGQDPDGEDIFLEMVVDQTAPYVHGQVLLTIKLYHVDALTEGRLSEPDVADAVIERLGEDTTYGATLGGTRYRVLERRYALFPERSGDMSVPAAVFRGRVADNRSGFNSIFDRGRRVSVASEPLALQVRQRPAEFTGGTWLPAGDFELEESWPDGGGAFRVGEPVTRRISLKARGLLAVQLPELTLPEVDGLKIYPDQSQQQSRHDGTWVYGEREQAYAIVPTREGPMTLPQIRIPWWDTAADEARVAIIPAREIVIRPGASASAPPTAQPLDPSASARPAGPWGDPRWPIATAVALVLWLVTLVAWLRARRGPGQVRARKATKEEPVGVREHRRRLRDACRAGDASLAAAALLGWARAEHGMPSVSLGALARRVETPALAEAITALDRHLYAGTPAADGWCGDALEAALSGGLCLRSEARGAHAVPAGALPPLYPET